MTLNDAADYILLKTLEGGESVSHLKLQKLVYYSQAWHLALYKRQLFSGRFQAWVHGPVSRDLYDRFRGTKSLYTAMSVNDITPGFDLEALPPEERSHLDEVLEVYAKFTGSQLEDMSHAEEPWIKARKGYSPGDRCENYIDEGLMTQYFTSQMAHE